MTQSTFVCITVIPQRERKRVNHSRQRGEAGERGEETKQKEVKGNKRRRLEDEDDTKLKFEAF